MRSNLTVVIPCVNGSPWMDEVLAALARQTIANKLEVLVPNRLTDGLNLRYARLCPGVKIFAQPGDTTIPAMRWAGLKKAQAPYVAYLEDHTPPHPEWAERILALHAEGHDAVGGPVSNGEASGLFNRIFFLCEYSGAMPPLPDGNVMTLPGNNVSFRKAFISHREDLAERWEDAWCEGIRDRRGAAYRSSDLTILHRNPLAPLEYFAQRYYYGRAFAAIRSRRTLWPIRVFQVFGALVLLPWLLPLRLLRTLAAKHALTPANLALTPLIWPYQLAGAWGEALGAWLGDGGALARVR